MTDKKRRQRGTRTHGGGSSKKRRGAGHRGGRGNAGRSKHEIHGQAPLGKHGFVRPKAVVEDVATVNVGQLDEDIESLVEAGLADDGDDGFAVDARDALDIPDTVDRVKVLGGGQVHRTIEVIADDFSASAVRKLEEAGGSATLADDLDTYDD